MSADVARRIAALAALHHLRRASQPDAARAIFLVVRQPATTITSLSTRSLLPVAGAVAPTLHGAFPYAPFYDDT